MEPWRTTATMIVAAVTVLAPVGGELACGACATDVTGDERVDVMDLLGVLADWGACEGCSADVNDDGFVDVLDLLAVLGDWGVNCPELAGEVLAGYPYFDYVMAFNQGEPVEIAIDPTRFPEIVGQTCDIYVVAAKTRAEWKADPSLTDLTRGPQTETFVAGTIQDNTFVISGGAGLSGDAGIGLGVPYDIVCDCDQDAELGDGDYIDGWGDVVQGMYVVHDVTQAGPLEVVELTYSCPNWDGATGYSAQNTFYPKEIGSMGQLPLIVVSHGGAHLYTWFDHVGMHMASWGYVVMSHANNTAPGVYTASTTTLEHTDIFLRELPNIASGVLEGHVDAHRITWIGHSRGGEGATIAYHRVLTGSYVPENFAADDIALLCAWAPTDFLTEGTTHPHGANFSLITAAADADVTGCAGCNLCQTYHLHDRAEAFRQSLTIQGMGHAWFHNGGGASWAAGPCLIGMENAHTILKGYLLPLVEHYAKGNVPGKDFLTRQWESFHPIGAPTSQCVVNDLMYRDGPAAGNFMIDDYQSEFDATISSSGGAVGYTVSSLWEGLNDDQNSTFTHATSDEMNGTTLGGTGDSTRGVVFEWNDNSYYELEIIESERDLADDAYLSFRAAQATRHPNTIAELGDLTFTVQLRDVSGVKSAINIGVYGGGLEEPYQRDECGGGVGWANEFETIRIRLADFTRNGSGIDLANVEAVRLNFGPAWGSDVGRIGLDEVEITRQ